MTLSELFSNAIVNKILAIVQDIQKKEVNIQMKVSEIASTLTAVSDQLSKAKGEILAKIAALETSLSNVDLPPDATAALDGLKTQAQALDDIVPDAPVV